jgi:hypothetical protein
LEGRTGGVIQAVEYLPNKHEVLSSNSSTTKTKIIPGEQVGPVQKGQYIHYGWHSEYRRKDEAGTGSRRTEGLCSGVQVSVKSVI